jgi:hypothetical protein
MQKVSTVSLASMIITTFMIGGICGYQYHSYTAKNELKHFLGVDDASAKKMHDFFDYKK